MVFFFWPVQATFITANTGQVISLIVANIYHCAVVIPVDIFLIRISVSSVQENYKISERHQQLSLCLCQVACISSDLPSHIFFSRSSLDLHSRDAFIPNRFITAHSDGNIPVPITMVRGYVKLNQLLFNHKVSWNSYNE